MTWPVLALTATLQTVTVEPPKAILWEYPDALVSEAVFVVTLDDTAPATLKPAEIKTTTDPEAPAGSSTYAFVLPALTVTTHTVVVKACNSVDVTICGPESRVDFRLLVAPVSVTGLRAK